MAATTNAAKCRFFSPTRSRPHMAHDRACLAQTSRIISSLVAQMRGQRSNPIHHDAPNSAQRKRDSFVMVEPLFDLPHNFEREAEARRPITALTDKEPDIRRTLLQRHPSAGKVFPTTCSQKPHRTRQSSDHPRHFPCATAPELYLCAA
jgi:hypothetical protein